MSWRLVRAFLLAVLITVAPASAQWQPDRKAVAQHWLYCQQGDLQKCNQLLRLPLDAETRALIEADREQIRDRLGVQIRALLQLCKERGNIRACDRPLRYDLTAVDRREVLLVRNAVLSRR